MIKQELGFHRAAQGRYFHIKIEQVLSEVILTPLSMRICRKSQNNMPSEVPLSELPISYRMNLLSSRCSEGWSLLKLTLKLRNCILKITMSIHLRILSRKVSWTLFVNILRSALFTCLGALDDFLSNSNNVS